MPEADSDANAQRPQHFLGFDFGTRRIGVAVGESVTATARPEATLRSHNNRPDWPSIEALIASFQPNTLVVGIPYTLDGSTTDLTDRAKRFARQLEGRFGIKVELCNEALSSAAARSHLRAHAERVHGDKDSIAAAVILEQWLSEKY